MHLQEKISPGFDRFLNFSISFAASFFSYCLISAFNSSGAHLEEDKRSFRLSVLTAFQRNRMHIWEDGYLGCTLFYLRKIPWTS
jgi:hypothetical protein